MARRPGLAIKLHVTESNAIEMCLSVGEKKYWNLISSAKHQRKKNKCNLNFLFEVPSIVDFTEFLDN